MYVCECLMEKFSVVDREKMNLNLGHSTQNGINIVINEILFHAFEYMLFSVFFWFSLHIQHYAITSEHVFFGMCSWIRTRKYTYVTLITRIQSHTLEQQQK